MEGRDRRVLLVAPVLLTLRLIDEPVPTRMLVPEADVGPNLRVNERQFDI